MCGGDALADQKKQAAQSQINLNNALSQGYSSRNAAQQPFLMSRLNGGLPFFHDLTDFSGGTLARSIAPMRAALNRNLSGFGDTLPSGFKEQALGNFDAEEGRAFDDNMVKNLMANEQTKQWAADALNPLGFASGATGAGSSVLSAPPVNAGGFGNFAAGAFSSLLSNAGAAGKTAGGMSWAI